MKIDRQIIVEHLGAYLRHETPLASLVAWAEAALMDAEIDDDNAATFADVLAHIGLADVREFGLSWEDCETLVSRLGYPARVELCPA